MAVDLTKLRKLVNKGDDIVAFDGPFSRKKLDESTFVQREEHFKPSGLWYSCGLEWLEWCENEGFRTDRYVHVYAVTLDKSRFKMIRTAEQLDQFHDELSATGAARRYMVDWAPVAAQYTGIEICPYIWERRMSHIDWYYAWDVASGCVWDTSCVLSVKSLARP